MSSVQPSRPRRTQAERTAESGRRLLEAAAELIAEKGYGATTAAEIGRRAGYSRAMVHARFGSREALLDELMRTEYEERVRQSSTPGTTGLERLLAHVDHLVALVAEDPEFLRRVFVLNFEGVFERSGLRPRMVEWIGELMDSLAESYAEGVADGSCRPGMVPAHVAERMVALGVGLAYCWLVVPGRVDYAQALQRWRDDVRAQCVAMVDAPC